MSRDGTGYFYALNIGYSLMHVGTDFYKYVFTPIE